MLGISHSAVLLLKRCQSKSTNDTLQVLETFPFDTIQQISPIRNGSTIDLRLKKNRITIHSHRVSVFMNEYLISSIGFVLRLKKLHSLWISF